MKLPNGDKAVVEDRKLLGYVLNEDHPVGRHHAFIFRVGLGITVENAAVLSEALLRAARENEAIEQGSDQYGRRFIVMLTMTGPRGAKNVRSVWSLKADQAGPRLITCFVE